MTVLQQMKIKRLEEEIRFPNMTLSQLHKKQLCEFLEVLNITLVS